MGKVDICSENSMMSSHLALSCSGHLESLFHMFSYINKHQNSEMLFDTTNPDFYMADFRCEE